MQPCNKTYGVPECGGCHHECEGSNNGMNCLCNLFDDCNIWILILILVVLFYFCSVCD